MKLKKNPSKTIAEEISLVLFIDKKITIHRKFNTSSKTDMIKFS